MTIQPGHDTATVKVPIVNDYIYEPDIEKFTVELEILSESVDMHVVNGSPEPVPVYIEDDDG